MSAAGVSSAPRWLTPPLVAGAALVMGTTSVVDGLFFGLIESGLSPTAQWRGVVCELLAALLAAAVTWFALRGKVEPLVPVITFPVAAVTAALVLPWAFAPEAAFGEIGLVTFALAGLLFGLSALVVLRAVARAREQDADDGVERALVPSGIWLSLLGLLASIPGLRWIPTTALALAILGLLWAIQRDARRLVWLRTGNRGAESSGAAAARPFVARLVAAATAVVFTGVASALLARR